MSVQEAFLALEGCPLEGGKGVWRRFRPFPISVATPAPVPAPVSVPAAGPTGGPVPQPAPPVTPVVQESAAPTRGAAPTWEQLDKLLLTVRSLEVEVASLTATVSAGRAIPAPQPPDQHGVPSTKRVGSPKESGERAVAAKRVAVTARLPSQFGGDVNTDDSFDLDPRGEDATSEDDSDRDSLDIESEIINDL